VLAYLVVGGTWILLVEDDDQIRAMNALILRRHGYKVLDAPTEARPSS
jgi:DNA-binding response OmpR family regulator